MADLTRGAGLRDDVGVGQRTFGLSREQFKTVASGFRRKRQKVAASQRGVAS